MSVLSFLARRFVAGETLQDGVAAAKKMNAQGIKGILDFLGEDVTSAEEAQAAAEEYVRLLQAIAAAKADSAVSLKVSQMGVLISPGLCDQNLRRVAAEAAKGGTFVWMDMEGSPLTQRTIEAFSRLRADFSNVGLCLQAYLIRTGADLEHLMRLPAKRAAPGSPAPGMPGIRICKGAYQEPATIAYANKQAVDGNFRMLTQKLLDFALAGNVFPAFATHDAKLIDFILGAVRERHMTAEQFEFQMLYGIRNRLLGQLARQGFQTRVYIPYGRAWFPYFMRRLRERKENLYFLMRNMFRM